MIRTFDELKAWVESEPRHQAAETQTPEQTVCICGWVQDDREGWGHPSLSEHLQRAPLADLGEILECATVGGFEGMESWAALLEWAMNCLEKAHATLDLVAERHSIPHGEMVDMTNEASTNHARQQLAEADER